MKIIKTVLLDGTEVPLAKEQIILELNNAGRGYITVETEAECTGKAVVFELGEHDDYYKWFDGYVESEQSAQPGYKKLLIRERAAKFEKPLNCSHRHITLKELAEWITHQTGIVCKVPDKAYSTEPIAQFAHSGSGYQLLTNIGRQFQIPHFIWQQAADGSVFIGSWLDSQWATSPVEVDHDSTLHQSGSRITLPISAAIRPGALINNKRIQKVELNGDNYYLDWEELDENGKPTQTNAERRQIEKQFPELAGGYHLPKRGKVVSISDPSSAGDLNNPFRPKYAVDVQLLDENGNDDSSVPVYNAVPLPVTSPSSQGGDFCYPEIGTIVEIGFHNGRSDQPFVRSFSAEGKTMPAIAPGEMLRQQRPEVFERTDQAGNMHKETDQTISEKSYQRKIETDSEHKTLGTATKDVDSDNTETVGGNKKTHVIGNIEEVTASNKNVGVGGNLEQHIQGVSKQISDAKNELIAPLSHVGTAGQNIFRILESLLQITADLAKAVAEHNHNGGPTPSNKSTMLTLSNSATTEKGKLTPIIA
ncbi:Uncharacterised protein [Actinobacillus lignieresii]|uniref:hypothetical protein n=1 Tax=Actinobacillus lignieresii TaxID=720 RepID=UPI000E1268CC|nr:hypothetical protein [Actinobacillus lignieresii]SUT95997.1 Uncharacterised protein [Actinobacillus lignieresii]